MAAIAIAPNTFIIPSASRPTAKLEIGTDHARTQRLQGKVVFVGDKMFRTEYPETEFEKAQRERRAAFKKDQAEALAKMTGKAIAKKVRGGNTGWNKRTLTAAKTAYETTDMKPMIDRIRFDFTLSTHFAFMTFTYPAGVITDTESTHKNIAALNKYLREEIGVEYMWNIEFKHNLQAHMNYVMALTKAEVKKIQAKWMRIAGWGADASMGEAANYSLSNTTEERNEGLRNIIGRRLGYMLLIGGSEKAIKKGHQYRTPQSWLDHPKGTGAMWGRSSGMKQMESTELVITNIRQRKAIDRYARRAFGIDSKIVTWAYPDGTMSDEFDVSAFSKDRIAGSKRVGKVTERMRRDIAEIIEALK